MLHSPSPSAPAPAPGWHIELDGNPAADDAAIDDLLAALDLAESDRVADAAPAAAGIEPACGAGRHRDPDRRARAAARSRRTRRGRASTRARARDGPIRVIGRRVLELVGSRADAAFRDRRLFPVDAAAVTSIAWRGDGRRAAS